MEKKTFTSTELEIIEEFEVVAGLRPDLSNERLQLETSKSLGLFKNKIFTKKDKAFLDLVKSEYLKK